MPARRYVLRSVEPDKVRKPLALRPPTLWPRQALSEKWWLCFSWSCFAQSWEINMRRDAFFQFNRLFPRCLALDPGIEPVPTRRQSGQSIPPRRIRHHKMRSIDHEHEPAHVLVNIATQRHKSGLVKNFRRNRPFLRTISAEIESFGRRIGEDAVIGVVEIREFDPCSDLDR